MRLRIRTRIWDTVDSACEFATSVLHCRGGVIIDILCGCLVFLAIVNFPFQVSAGGFLDNSWSEALYHLEHKNAQAGVDYVFTFGPFGSHVTGSYNRFHPRTQFVVAIGLGGISTWLLILFARTLPSLRWRLAYYGLTILLTIQMPICGILATGAFVAFHVTGLFLRGQPSRIVMIGSALTLAFLVLTKFTLALNSFLSVLSITALFVYERRYRDGLLFAGLFIAAVGGFWLAAGQSLERFPEYLGSSFELSNGYSAAMALESRHPTFWTSLVVLLLVGLAAAINAIGPARGFRTSLLMCYLLIVLWLNWKHGYVRDDEHVRPFFIFAMICVFLLAPVGPRPSVARVETPQFAVMLVSFYGLLIATDVNHTEPNFERLPRYCLEKIRANFWTLRHPTKAFRQLEERTRLAAAASDLPLIRSEVQGSSIDVFTVDQSTLFLNGMNWTPRPVFQSYAAYSESLAKRNLDFYRSDRAPMFVLVNILTIDQRLPTSEDGPVLAVLLSDYEPVRREKGFLLLKRRATLGATTAAPPDAVSGTARLGDEISVPHVRGHITLLSLDTRITQFGRLRKFLYRLPAARLNLVMSNGEQEFYRLIPDMARLPMPLDPLIRDSATMLSAYDSEAIHGIDKVSLQMPKVTGGRILEESFDYTFTFQPIRPVDPANLQAIRSEAPHLKKSESVPIPHVPVSRASTLEPRTVPPDIVLGVDLNPKQ